MARERAAKAAGDLTITSEPVEPRQLRLTVVVSPAREEREMVAVAQAYARHMKVPGYRPGKVPLRLVLAQVGEDDLRAAAREQLAEKVAREAVSAEGLEPVGHVVLEDQTDDPLTYTLLVPLPPEVSLGDYRALRVPRPAAEPVTEAEVEERLQSLRQELAHLETVDRPAEAGDHVVLALLGRLGERVVVEDEALTLVLSPEGASDRELPPAIVDRLLGLAAGESARFELAYSEFWPDPELQGASVAFEARVENVQGLVVPALDDAFAQEVSDAASLEELTGRVRASLELRRDIEARERWIEAAVDALLAGAEISAPPVVLADEVSGEIADLRRRVESQGFSWERWLQLQDKDEDALAAELEPEAAERMNKMLVLREFAAREGIRVNRAEVEDSLRRQNEALAGTGLRLRRTDAVRRHVASDLLSGRVIDRLLAIVGGEEAAGPVGEDGEPAATGEALDAASGAP